METNNPFLVTTPENMSAEEAVELFVDVFTDFSQLLNVGHAIVRGPRGVGKSMMFRYLQPDCQCIAAKRPLRELNHLGIYIPLRSAGFTRFTELRKIDIRDADTIVSEHVMICYLLSRAFSELSRLSDYENDSNEKQQLSEFFNGRLAYALGGAEGDNLLSKDIGAACTADTFQFFCDSFDNLYRQASDFIARSDSKLSLAGYEGPLFTYLDDFIPIMDGLTSLDFLPSGPVFLLVDDAHMLTKTQTRILNSWIASRTSKTVSLKVSTQYDYKTLYTTMGMTIDAPHDYDDIDLTVVYTSARKRVYRTRVKDIVEKRLKRAGIGASAEEFFPQDEKQEREIKKIEEQYIERFDAGKGRGAKRHDDANRYARPDYIKSLGGDRKSTSTYSYAGFDQLVHLSSGVIRSFITSAFKMYSVQESRHGTSGKVDLIEPSLQSEIARNEANDYLLDLYDRGCDLDECSDGKMGQPDSDAKRLFNLIVGLGSTFRSFLLSDRSERRIFSVALTDDPVEEINNVFSLGVKLGYFHRATIGRKDGDLGGRVPLFILNRRLAPCWNLDPTSFAGYWFTTNDTLFGFMVDPKTTARRVARDLNGDSDDSPQLALFNY